MVGMLLVLGVSCFVLSMAAMFRVCRVISAPVAVSASLSPPPPRNSQMPTPLIEQACDHHAEDHAIPA